MTHDLDLVRHAAPTGGLVCEQGPKVRCHGLGRNVTTFFSTLLMVVMVRMTPPRCTCA